MVAISKMSPFVSMEWILEQFDLTDDEIMICSEPHRKRFIERCADPNVEITKRDAELLEKIYKWKKAS
jgi:hypothetical protein